MNRVFVDMDGVLVDFDGYMKEHGLTGHETKTKEGAYRDMKPIEGAIEAVYELERLGYEVWIATKPPTGQAHAYGEKAEWIFKYLVGFERRLIITPDKGLFGEEGDYLCDDRPHKANCRKFKGHLLEFVDGYHWPEALQFFRQKAREFN
jgi:hypothetical protein